MSEIAQVSHIHKGNWEAIVTDEYVIFMKRMIQSVHINRSEVDPDGVPLMFFNQSTVTRARRLTDEEKRTGKFRVDLETTFTVQTTFVKEPVPTTKKGGK